MKEIEYYYNGCKKHSISFFNNKFDGPMLKWNEDCTLISEANYENGKLHGYFNMYYSESLFSVTINFFTNRNCVVIFCNNYIFNINVKIAVINIVIRLVFI